MLSFWTPTRCCSAVLAGWVLLLAQPGLSADAPAVPPNIVDTQPRIEASIEPADVARTVQVLQGLQTELQLLTPQTGVAPAAINLEGKFSVTCDAAHLGMFYTLDGPTRFIAIHLLAVNLTDKAVEIPRERMTAIVDGEAGVPVSTDGQFANAGFQYGDQHQSLQGMNGPKVWTIPARGCHGLWLAYGSVAVGTEVPPVQVKLRVAEKDHQLDINALQHAALGRRIERIGPRQCLALYTMRGMLNSVNAGGLMADLDLLGKESIHRVVVNWTAEAPVPDGQLLSWLQNSALQLGSGRVVSETLPRVPPSVRELHLVKFADGKFPSNDYSGRPLAVNRVHDSRKLAVSAALRSLMNVLPQDDLVAEIRHGHPLSRVAALEHGGSRLHEDQVPLLIGLAQAEDQDLQSAAVQALGNFGDAVAVAQLTRWIHEGLDPRAAAAIDALASSRFRAAHDALRGLLAGDAPLIRQRILKVLAAHPRPLWVNELYDAATAPGAQASQDLLLALVQLGHPKVTDLLQAALAGNNRNLQGFAFGILSQRNDPRSEQLAMEFLLERLKTSPPDGNMIQLLSRTRDPRAVPLLIKLLDGQGDHAQVINLLGQYADPAALEKLLTLYAKLRPHERVQVLQALRQMEHPRFLELAREAFQSQDNQLITAAVQGLVELGSDPACEAVIEALGAAKEPYVVSQLCGALGKLSQPVARATLLKERRSAEKPRRDAAAQALEEWKKRSPGWVYLIQAQTQLREDREDDARELMGLAIQADPELTEAWSGRGNIRLRAGKLPEAEQDFSKALALDEFNSEGLTGVAIVQVMTGRLEMGLKTIESRREEFGKDRLFLYNAACMYGRAIEAVEKLPDGGIRRKEFRDKAITDLTHSLQLGFDQLDWMAKDPDLKSLHGDTEFEKLCRGEIPEEEVEPPLEQPDR